MSGDDQHWQGLSEAGQHRAAQSGAERNSDEASTGRAGACVRADDGSWSVTSEAGLNGVINDGYGDRTIGEMATPTAAEVRRIAARRDEPADTALMFSRSEEGKACRERAAGGNLTNEDKVALPNCFHELLPHLQPPTNPATGVAVKPADYLGM